MLVKSLIRQVDHRGDAQKPFAIVTLETTHPLQIIQVRLFSNSVKDGTAGLLADHVGKWVQMPLEAELYGRDGASPEIQFRLAFGQFPIIEEPPAPKGSPHPAAGTQSRPAAPAAGT